MTLCIALLIMNHVSEVLSSNPDIVQYLEKKIRHSDNYPFLRQVVSTSVLNTSRTNPDESREEGGREVVSRMTGMNIAQE